MPTEKKGSTNQKEEQIDGIIESVMPGVENYFHTLTASQDELREAMKENKELLNSFMQKVRESLMKIKNDKLDKAYADAEKRGFSY